MTGLALAFRLAWRDLRGGLAGFTVFLGCLALGVGAIAAVGTTARGLNEGLAREGRTILGGDVSFALVHREASAAERAFLAGFGRVSVAATLRAMARAVDRPDQALVELKAVDDVYPLAGTLALEPPVDPRTLFAARAGVLGATAEPALLARLNLAVGDRLRVGDALFEIRAALRAEPDKLAAGVGFGPRLLVGLDGLQASGLVQPGSLVRWHYRVALADQRDAGVEAITAAAQERFPDAGWEIRSRANASPQLARNIERFSQFLVLVGLTALVVGGVGVANAVKAHLDGRRTTIATFKALGAPGGFVVLVFLAQTAMIAALGIALGLVLGVVLPALAALLVGDLLPFPLVAGVYPRELGLAAAYGAATALAFALWPLGRAHDVPVQALYREHVAARRGTPRLRYLALVAGSALVLVALAVGLAQDMRLAALYTAAAGLSFLALRLVALGVMAVARRLPRPRRVEWRLALANMHRPGALTPTVVLSLGLGLTLLVALALIDANLRRQITATLPERAPSFFFLDIPSREIDGFRGLLADRAPAARVETVPMLRGRIVSVKGIPADAYPAAPGASWALSGERGITYAAEMPANAALVSGEWWPGDHSGQALVSVEARVAEGLRLAVGDRLVVNVLGRTIEAVVANTRRVQWETLGINFVLVFSPNTFRGAPHTHLATLTTPPGMDATGEMTLAAAVTTAFPAVVSIRVKEALEAVDALVGQLALAVRGAASIALVASVLVLAGALAAGHRARVYDAVVLKTLGATRARLVAAFALEYLLVGAVTALFAVAVGAAAAWVVIARVMDLPFAPMPGVAAAAAGGALVVTVVLGLVGTWRILRHRPAPLLRSA